MSMVSMAFSLVITYRIRHAFHPYYPYYPFQAMKSEDYNYLLTFLPPFPYSLILDDS